MTFPSRAPSPPEILSTETRHGIVLSDEFRWMLDVDSPAMRHHLRSEAAYADVSLGAFASLAESVAVEMASRHVESHSAPATPHGRWWYYTRRPAGENYLEYWRSDIDPALGHSARESLMLDGNAIARNSGGFSLGPFRVSTDHRWLAYGVDPVGNERFVLRFRNLETGEHLPDELLGTHYTCAWAAAGDQILYVTADDANRPHRVWRHRLGSEQAEDVLVMEEPDPSVWLTVGSTRSGDILFIRGAAHTSTEFRVLDAHAPEKSPRLLRAREPGVYYEIDHRKGPRGGALYVLHNINGPDFELAVASTEVPEQWSTIIPHSPGRRLHWAVVFETAVVVYSRTGGLTGLIWLPFDADTPKELNAEAGATLSPASNPDYAATCFRYSYTSPTTPTSIRALDLATGTTTTIDTMSVGRPPGKQEFKSKDYMSEELWATADDGVQIPITIVRRRDIKGDAVRGCVLYAYGAYERTADMGFSAHRLSLLDRGVSYAVAHVRGGGELGKHWHESGRLSKKQNSIDDYLACARHLIERGYARRGGVVGRSSSAGGIVLGAALNTAPDLFAGIVLSAPFVDPLTSLLDPTRALTAAEWEELGNPLTDPDAYALIRSYSPYQNIADRQYPPVLAIAGNEDSRVSIAEPARWIARLRARAQGGPFILLPQFDSGHRGPMGRVERLKRDALVTAWILEIANANRTNTDGAAPTQ
jgi:oligopeptidase B